MTQGVVRSFEIKSPMAMWWAVLAAVAASDVDLDQLYPGLGYKSYAGFADVSRGPRNVRLQA